MWLEELRRVGKSGFVFTAWFDLNMYFSPWSCVSSPSVWFISCDFFLTASCKPSFGPIELLQKVVHLVVGVTWKSILLKKQTNICLVIHLQHKFFAWKSRISQSPATIFPLYHCANHNQLFHSVHGLGRRQRRRNLLWRCRGLLPHSPSSWWRGVRRDMNGGKKKCQVIARSDFFTGKNLCCKLMTLLNTCCFFRETLSLHDSSNWMELLSVIVKLS